MTALIYLRVSTGAQAAKELPLDTQKEACLRFAQNKEYVVATDDVYIDAGESGRSMEGRNALQLLLERCKSDLNVKAVIIYDISRLSRNAIEYQAMKGIFKKRGITLLSVNEPTVGDGDSASSWMLEFMLSGFAEFRSRQDGEKIKNSMKNKVLNGGFCGYAPYGYKNVQEATSSNKSKRWIEPNETEAPWVTRCHDLFATNEYTYAELAEKLGKEGMRARNGKRIHVSLIERIMKDELYIGVVKWGGARCENGVHKRLVDEEIFRTNQDLIAGRSGGVLRQRKHLFIIRSLAPVCGECGSRWTAGYHKYGKYCAYSCTKRQKSKKVECHQSSVATKVLEGQFESLFQRMQMSPEAVEEMRESARKILSNDDQTLEKIYTSLNTKLENNRLSQKRLIRKYAEGKVNDEIYEETQKTLESEEVLLKGEIAKAEVKLKTSKRVVEMGLLLANNCYRAYQKAPSDEFRALLAQAFFRKVVLKDKNIYQAELNYPFYFLAENRVSKMREFQLAYSGGSRRTLLEYLVRLPQEITQKQMVLLERVYGQVLAMV